MLFAVLEPGTKLGRYEIRSHLGTGGMGDVYLGWETRLDRKVAFKQRSKFERTEHRVTVARRTPLLVFGILVLIVGPIGYAWWKQEVWYFMGKGRLDEAQKAFDDWSVKQ